MPSLAFTADSRQTEAGRLYNRSEEDETRIPLQKAIDDADYEHGHRVNELDYLTAFRSPVAVARKSNCAFNTVRVSSTGRPWIVDNDSRGGDDEHAQPNAELAIELTGQTRAERRTRLINLRAKTDIPLSALLCATFTTEEAAAAAEAAAAVKAAVEAGKKQRLEAATAAKLRGEPFAECSWREGGRQHEDARRARASLDAHRAAAAQMNETRQWQLRVASARKAAESACGGSKLDCSTHVRPQAQGGAPARRRGRGREGFPARHPGGVARTAAAAARPHPARRRLPRHRGRAEGAHCAHVV
jgi:hypothetical protein